MTLLTSNSANLNRNTIDKQQSPATLKPGAGDCCLIVWARIPRRENGAIANVFDLAPDWAIPDKPTEFYDKPTARLPIPAFAQEFSLTVEGLFNWLLE